MTKLKHILQQYNAYIANTNKSISKCKECISLAIIREKPHCKQFECNEDNCGVINQYNHHAESKRRFHQDQNSTTECV